MKRKPHAYAIGDRVAYSAAWLRSTGQRTGPYGQLRGTVTGLAPFGGGVLVGIQWDGAHAGNVLDANLNLVSRIGIDSALAT